MKPNDLKRERCPQHHRPALLPSVLPVGRRPACSGQSPDLLGFTPHMPRFKSRLSLQKSALDKGSAHRNFLPEPSVFSMSNIICPLLNPVFLLGRDLPKAFIPLRRGGCAWLQFLFIVKTGTLSLCFVLGDSILQAAFDSFTLGIKTLPPV